VLPEVEHRAGKTEQQRIERGQGYLKGRYRPMRPFATRDVGGLDGDHDRSSRVSCSDMTDRLGALTALVRSHSPHAEPALHLFYEMFRHEPLVIDTWFSLQASAPEVEGQTFARVKQLLKHPDFSIRNPNRARSLLGALFNGNPSAFHRADAAGYVLWADQVILLDGVNPQFAARFARVLDRWSHLAEPYRSAACAAIQRVAAKPDLSGNVREIVTNALAN